MSNPIDYKKNMRNFYLASQKDSTQTKAVIECWTKYTRSTTWETDTPARRDHMHGYWCAIMDLLDDKTSRGDW
jgi:hypothetical protein